MGSKHICRRMRSTRLFLSHLKNTQKRWSSTAPSLAGFNDYDATVRDFKLVAPTYYNFATDVIDKWARIESDYKKTPAFWWSDDDNHTIKWSFSDLSDKSKRVANILTGPCGLQKGDRVLVILPGIPEWWLINVASIRAGVVLIPGTTQLTSHDILMRLQRSGAKAIIVGDEHADQVDEVEKECPELKKKLLLSKSSSTRKDWLSWLDLYNHAPPDFEAAQTKADDPMSIFFTSGTTGSPKMTEHTHASYGLGHYITGKFFLDLTPNDILWNLSDTGWAKSAYSNVFAPWIHGSCVFTRYSTRKFDPLQTLEILSENPIDVFCSAPTGYRMMVQQNMNQFDGLNNVRHYVSGGEPLNPEVLEVWQEKVDRLIREGYGQTETVLICSSFRCIPNKPGSMGKPAPGITLKVVDDAGQEVETGKEGNIGLKIKPHRPVGLFTRYVDEPERTSKVFVGDYYLTGDRGVVDEDGYFWFVGRDDDVITSAGYRIGPFEVESALIEHPAVVESAVVSSPDSIRGAVVKAFVVLTDEFKDKNQEDLKKDIQEHVKKITAPYKYPREIEFVKELPKTISGKIRRIELRQKEWQKG